MGRPTKTITEQHLSQIRVLSGLGLTEAAIARVLGMTPRTFRYKKNEQRVFSALQEGKAQAETKIGKALFEKALTGDVRAIEWWEKTRAGRNEKVVQEHTGKNGGAIEQRVEHTDNRDRDAAYNDLFAQIEAYRTGYNERDRTGDPAQSIHSDDPDL